MSVVGTDESLWDLHLASTDTVNRDAGTTGAIDDFDRQLRPQGLAWDIGADEYALGPGLLGDLDGDGDVDTQDLQRLVNVLLQLETDPAVIARADLDGWGGVAIQDLQRLVNLLLGL